MNVILARDIRSKQSKFFWGGGGSARYEAIKLVSHKIHIQEFNNVYVCLSVMFLCYMNVYIFEHTHFYIRGSEFCFQ